MISSTDIELWSNTRQSQENLPLLIRRLITNNIDSQYILECDIPSGDSIWKPGNDGSVKITINSILGEAGTYKIECGANSDYKTKFKADLSKRSEPLCSLTDHVFVFISARKIRDKQKVISDVVGKVEKASFWKDIKIFDADNIETWLNQDYATTAWFCNLLRKRCDDIYDFNKKWKEWCDSTSIALDADVILARDNIYEDEINDWLLSDKSIIEVRSSSKKESLLYLLASITRIKPQETQERIKSKIVIIENKLSWNMIVGTLGSKKLILVPLFGIPTNLGSLVDKGFKIYLPLANYEPKQTNCNISIKNISTNKLLKILEPKCNVDKWFLVERNFSDNDILSLQRLLRKEKAPLEAPVWSKPENADILLFLSVFSSWEESKDKSNLSKDTLLIERVLENSYEDFKKQLVRLSTMEETPIQQVDNIFQATNPKLVIEYLGSYLTSEYFFRLFKNVEEVLLDVIEGLNFYSKKIKVAVIRALALFANNKEFFNESIDIEGTINDIINKLFDIDDRRWFCWNYNIPLFFEASPSVMVEKLAKLVANKDSFTSIIKHEGNGTYYSILKGLESIAWEPDFLRSATDIYLKIQENYGDNQPSRLLLRSFYKIYSVRYPQTLAPIDARKEILQSLVLSNKYNSALETLLVSLLPGSCISYADITVPAYLPYKLLELKVSDFYDMCDFIFTQLLILVKKSGNWDRLIKADINFFSKEVLQEFVDALSALNFKNFTDEQKHTMQDSITWVLHSYYLKKKAESITQKELWWFYKLKTIIKKIVFKEYYKQYLSLFKHFVSPIDNSKLYRKALDNILEKEGLKGIINLLKELHKSRKFFCIGKIIDFIKERNILDNFLEEYSLKFKEYGELDDLIVSFFSNNFYEIINHYWKDEWSNAKKQQILSILNCRYELFEWVKKKNLGDLYWNRKNFWIIFKDKKELDIVLHNLKEYENYQELLNVIWLNKESIDVSTIIDLLERPLNLLENTSKSINISWQDQVKDLFDILYAKNIDQDILLKLEVKYFYIWSYVAIPKIIKKLITDPTSSFFADVIEEAYSKSDINKIENKNKKINTNTVNFLNQDFCWNLLFTIESYYIFDNVKNITTWFSHNKKLLQSCNCLQEGLLWIGKALSLCPKDIDGVWPLQEIRSLIESEESDNLEIGIYLGKVNSIGVRRITPDAKEMLKSYEEFKAYANKLKNSCPRTKKIVERISKDYQNLAKEDQNIFKIRIR